MCQPKEGKRKLIEGKKLKIFGKLSRGDLQYFHYTTQR
jgi:hypothetical protein